MHPPPSPSALHPLCGPVEGWPARYWGPERLDPLAWRELAGLIDAGEEIEALVAALAGVSSIADVGGGTGLLTRALAARVAPVIVVEPSAAQRAELPDDDARIRSAAGRAERVPLADGAVEAALATWVLQYTDDPDAAVGELIRIARARVVIVQAAPDNDLVDVYNAEAAVAGLPRAHHGWLLARAAAALEAAGFSVELTVVPTRIVAAAGGATALADTLARLHFAGHPAIERMRAATEPLVAAKLAAGGGALRDDGVVLVARRASFDAALRASLRTTESQAP